MSGDNNTNSYDPTWENFGVQSCVNFMCDTIRGYRMFLKSSINQPEWYTSLTLPFLRDVDKVSESNLISSLKSFYTSHEDTFMNYDYKTHLLSSFSDEFVLSIQRENETPLELPLYEIFTLMNSKSTGNVPVKKRVGSHSVLFYLMLAIYNCFDDSENIDSLDTLYEHIDDLSLYLHRETEGQGPVNFNLVTTRPSTSQLPFDMDMIKGLATGMGLDMSKADTLVELATKLGAGVFQHINSSLSEENENEDMVEKMSRTMTTLFQQEENKDLLRKLVNEGNEAMESNKEKLPDIMSNLSGMVDPSMLNAIQSNPNMVMDMMNGMIKK